ncbi:MAG: DUF4834 family protein [Sodaliphilus sp.]
MWEILIFIFTGFVIYQTMRLVKWIQNVNRTRKEIHQTFEDMFSQMCGTRQHRDGGSNSHFENNDVMAPKQQSRKLFTASDGEYTDFEEVTEKE